MKEISLRVARNFIAWSASAGYASYLKKDPEDIGSHTALFGLGKKPPEPQKEKTQEEKSVEEFVTAIFSLGLEKNIIVPISEYTPLRTRFKFAKPVSFKGWAICFFLDDKVKNVRIIAKRPDNAVGNDHTFQGLFFQGSPRPGKGEYWIDSEYFDELKEKSIEEKVKKLWDFVKPRLEKLELKGDSPEYSK